MNYNEIKEIFKKLSNIIADDKAIIEEKENYIMRNHNVINCYNYKSYNKDIAFSVYEDVIKNKIEVTFNVTDIQEGTEDYIFINPSRKLIKSIVNTIRFNSNIS